MAGFLVHAYFFREAHGLAHGPFRFFEEAQRNLSDRRQRPMMARVLYLYNDKPKELGVFHGCLLLRSPPRDARARLLAWPLAKSLLATATAFRRQRRTAERRARAPAYARGRGHHSPPRASAPAASDLPPPPAASTALAAAVVPTCGVTRGGAGARHAHVCPTLSSRYPRLPHWSSLFGR